MTELHIENSASEVLESRLAKVRRRTSPLVVAALLTAVDLPAARNEILVSAMWAKLRSVDSTAALSDTSLTRAVDATDGVCVDEADACCGQSDIAEMCVTAPFLIR